MVSEWQEEISRLFQSEVQAATTERQQQEETRQADIEAMAELSAQFDEDVPRLFHQVKQATTERLHDSRHTGPDGRGRMYALRDGSGPNSPGFFIWLPPNDNPKWILFNGMPDVNRD